MTEITHPELVSALLKSGAEIAQKMTASEADLWHNATGVSGEAGEILEAAMQFADTADLDIENMVEELGDIEFYLEGYRQNLRLQRQPITLPYGSDDIPLLELAAGLSVAAAGLLDLTKKFVVYKKPLTSELLEQIVGKLQTVEFWLELIRRTISVTYEQAVAANIYKLGTGPNARYKDLKYSNEAAQARADKQVN